jgi:hypothetical protein
VKRRGCSAPPIGCDPDVDLQPPPLTGPRPDIAVHLAMQVVQEVVGQQILQRHLSCQNGGQQFFGDLLLHRLFKVIDVSPADRLIERLDDMGKQRGQLVIGKRCFTVPGSQRGQRFRPCRSARRRFTPALRTWPAGTYRLSNFAEALVARAAAFLITVWRIADGCTEACFFSV